MDVTFRVWIPEDVDVYAVVSMLESHMNRGSAPLPDIMQSHVDRSYGRAGGRVQRLFSCTYPRGPLRAGPCTGLRTHSHIRQHVESLVTPAFFPNAEEEEPIQAFTCSICLEEVTRASEQMFLPCMHKFHRRCMAQWYVGGGTTCPECRCSISPSLRQ